MTYLYAVRMLIPGHPVQPVKIGFSANPNSRMHHYGAGPYPCEWLGVWLGTMEDESALHVQFRKIRLAGEWFAPNQEFLSVIQTKIREHQEFLTSHGILERKRQERERAMSVLSGYYGDGLDVA